MRHGVVLSAGVELRELGAQEYARSILPQTAPLWAGRRNFETYVSQTLALACGGYGQRRFRTFGLYDGSALVASFKRYERMLHVRSRRLRAIGIGAVFTAPAYRGRGYASVMLAGALDRARDAGYDLAYLFSDIRPQFYAALGFSVLPSRELSLRAGALPEARLELALLQARDWSGLRRCFDSSERSRSAGFLRTPLLWEWIRMRVEHGSEHALGDVTNLVVRRGRSICAYVLGARVPERDAYVVDEYGYADDDAAAAIPSLLRAAAGDLRRVMGWLPPGSARDLLPRGAVRKRRHSIFMAAPLSPDGARCVGALAQTADSDPCWAIDHI